jgi:hypothetical protein
MGVSYDAELFYGILLKENTSFDHGWESMYMEKLGFKEPDYETEKKLYDKWYDKKRKIIKELGVSIITHCCSEEPMCAVMIEKSNKSASLGYPEQIHNLDKEIFWDEKIEDFCKFMELETDSKIGWWMCSYVG